MTRFTFSYLKPVALFPSIVVLFRCFRVYGKTSVTIEKAVNVDHEKIKHIRIDMVYGAILFIDSIYFKGDDVCYNKKVYG